MGFFSNFPKPGSKQKDEYEDEYPENNSGYYDFDDKDNFSDAEPVNEAEPKQDPKQASKPAVSLKLVKPYSPREATEYVDMLKNSCIVVIDISALTRETALRLIDYLSGAVCALDGDLKKTNQNTLVVAPKDVDISSMIPANPVQPNVEEPEEEEEDEA